MGSFPSWIRAASAAEEHSPVFCASVVSIDGQLHMILGKEGMEQQIVNVEKHAFKLCIPEYTEYGHITSMTTSTASA